VYNRRAACFKPRGDLGFWIKRSANPVVFAGVRRPMSSIAQLGRLAAGRDRTSPGFIRRCPGSRSFARFLPLQRGGPAGCGRGVDPASHRSTNCARRVDPASHRSTNCAGLLLSFISRCPERSSSARRRTEFVPFAPSGVSTHSRQAAGRADRGRGRNGLKPVLCCNPLHTSRSLTLKAAADRAPQSPRCHWRRTHTSVSARRGRRRGPGPTRLGHARWRAVHGAT
jgi:hypothetical protein